MASYIADGQNRDGYIAGSLPGDSGEQLYDSLEFTYRPATRSEWITLDAKVRIALTNEAVNPECALNAEKLACQFVADHLLSWNLTIEGIHDVPLTVDSMLRVNGNLFAKMYQIIRGNRISDKKPDAAESPKSDAAILGN